MVGTSQFVRMFDSVEGVSMSMHLCFMAFLTFMAMIALNAHRAHATRATIQILAIYLVGFGAIGPCTALLAKHLLTGFYIWTRSDTITMLCAAVGSVLIVGTLGKRYSIHDPIVRGLLATCSKALPQLLMAWKMWRDGGEGYAAVAIWTAHITTLIRLGQVILSRERGGKWTRSHMGLFIGEGTNELSWTLVTIAWLFGGSHI